MRERDGEGWKQTFRVGRIMCQKPITARAGDRRWSPNGKSGLIKGFISKKGRPFDAFLKMENGRMSWEFPPRAPKIGKDGKPIERKAKAKVDLSKATVIGQSKTPAGDLVELDDAYYVRKTDQDNRQIFKLSKKLCEHEITVAEVTRLLNEGKTELIEDFVSKRGSKFGAYLILAQKQDKAEFEFPPR